jgi:hypothetical protein
MQYGLPEFGLDPEDLTASAELFTGRGFWLEFGEDDFEEGESAEDRIDRRFRAAGAYAIGASYYALVDPAAANIVYATAARMYDNLDSLYAAIPALCARVTSVVERQWARARALDVETLLPGQFVPVTLLALWAERRVERGPSDLELLQRLARFGPLEVGESRLPLRLYLELHGGEAGRIRERDGLFERWVERLEEARLDAFSWVTLATRFLPVDPEILAAATIATDDRSSRFAGRNDEPREQRLGGQLAQVPLRISERMREADDRSPKSDVLINLRRRLE